MSTTRNLIDATRKSIMGNAPKVETTPTPPTATTPPTPTTESKTEPVVAPAPKVETTPTPQEKNAHTWDELVKEIKVLDEDQEKEREAAKKKQRKEQIIAAIGDFATHAMNIWSASNGYSMPIQGAPLMEGVNKAYVQKEAERAERYNKRKQRLKDMHTYRLRDAELKIKQDTERRLQNKAESQAELEELKAEKLRTETQWRTAKAELDKTKAEREIKLIDQRINELQNKHDSGYWNRVGNKRAKRTYTVDGIEYDNVYDAFTALPQDMQNAAKGWNGTVTMQTMELAIANHGKQKKEIVQTTTQPENKDKANKFAQYKRK